jgi:hypothetical protein
MWSGIGKERRTGKVSFHSRGIETVCFFETLAVGVVEGVEVEAAVCGGKGGEGEEGGEEVHFGRWYWVGSVELVRIR